MRVWQDIFLVNNYSFKKERSMRIVVATVALLSMSLCIPGADLSGRDETGPIRLTQVIKDGTLRISAKNISRQPILAYVIAMENGAQAETHHDFFTGRDVFAPGKKVELVFAISSTAGAPRVFVDYVRLADNSNWGNRITDDGKDVSASFQK